MINQSQREEAKTCLVEIKRLNDAQITDNNEFIFVTWNSIEGEK